MEVLTVKVTDIQEWKNNARIHTKRNLEALKENLKKFGQTKPLLVQKSSMRIIAGNGTYQAICSLGWETVDIRLFDLDDKDAELLAIADNRIGDLSQFDNKILTDSLQILKEAGTLELAGYDSLELDKLLSYQSGDLFKDLSSNQSQEAQTNKKESQKPTIPASDKQEETSEMPSYEDQLSFTLNGFVFTLADTSEIEELRCLIDILKDAEEKDRQEINQKIFREITEILTQKFMR